MAFYSFPQEFQCCLAITALRDEAFQDFPLMIHGPPKRVRSPLIFTNTSSRCHCQCVPDRIRSTRLRRISTANIGPNLFHQNRTVSWLMSMPHSCRSIFHIPQRERKPQIHHNSQAYDLGARLKVTKGGTFCHPATLITRPARLKKSFSDSARKRNSCGSLSYTATCDWLGQRSYFQGEFHEKQNAHCDTDYNFCNCDSHSRFRARRRLR
jgi:hypothetical protein